MRACHYLCAAALLIAAGSAGPGCASPSGDPSGSGGTGNTGLGMYAGSSPSITGLWASSGYEVAFEANTTALNSAKSMASTAIEIGRA